MIERRDDRPGKVDARRRLRRWAQFAVRKTAASKKPPFFVSGAGDGNRTPTPSSLSDQPLTASDRATKWFPKWFLGK